MAGSIVARRNIGSVSKDGKTIIKEMIYWNAVNSCDPEKCGCSSICNYYLSGKELSKCEIIYGYMTSVLDMIIRNYPKELTEDVAYRIGMHLIPLYKILCRLKMAEFATLDVVSISAAGSLRVTPVFKEIRDTIQLIEKTWRNIGFDVTSPNKKAAQLREVGYFNGKSYYEVIEGGVNVEALEKTN